MPEGRDDAASTAEHAPMRRKPTTVARSTGGLREHLAERAAAARDAHAPDLGGEDEPRAAADQDHRRSGACPRPCRSAWTTKVMTTGASDPDDLLQRGVEREQGGELLRVHHLRVDGAHGRLDRRRRRGRRRGRAPCSRGRACVEQGERRDGRGADHERQGEHAAHAPRAHPPARDGAGDRLPDRLVAARTSPAEPYEPVTLLDVQQDREASHPVREPRRQLCSDDARHAGRAQKIPVSRHQTTVPVSRDAATRHPSRHAATRRDDVSTGDRMSEPRRSVPPVDGSSRRRSESRDSGLFRCSRESACLWMKRWRTCVVSGESGGKLHGCNYYPLWCSPMSVPICSIGLPAEGLPEKSSDLRGETDQHGDHGLHEALVRAVQRDVPRTGREGHRVRDPRPVGGRRALEQVKALGYLQAPVVITDEDHWSGFRPDKIDELAARLA